MTTIKDIARISGYSIGTVSRVLNHHPDVNWHTRKVIEKIIAEQDFHPNSNAKMLKQQIDSSIAIIVRGYGNIFFGVILERIQMHLRQANESATVIFVDENADEVQTAVQLSITHKPKGFIFLGGNLHFFQDQYARIPVPGVLLTNDATSISSGSLSSFMTDDTAASACAVRYLLAHGHRSVSIVGGCANDTNSQVGTRRLKGCRLALEEFGLPFNESRDYEPCCFSMEDGYRAALSILKRKPDCTAVFALSDTIALGAMRAARDLGRRCPEDISIIGFDGIDANKYTVPRLATIHQDADMLARKGVEDLLLRLQYDRAAVNEVIPFTLREGESVKALS